MTASLRFVIVRVGGRDFAVPAARVCGMLHLRGLDVQPVQGPGLIRYTTSLHGRALPIVVPNSLLGLDEGPPSPRACILLIRSGAAPPAAPADAHCALAVDSISRIEEIPPVYYRPPGRVRVGEKWRDVIDLDRLCRVPAHASRNRNTN